MRELKALKDAFRKARLARGLSIRGIHTLTGLSRRTVRNIEAGDEDVKLTSLMKYCEALWFDLGLTVRDALDLDDEGEAEAPPF